MIRELLIIANELDQNKRYSYSDKLEALATVVKRKSRSPISKQNLEAWYKALQIAKDSPHPETRKMAEEKLQEYDAAFRQYTPELFQLPLDIEIGD